MIKFKVFGTSPVVKSLRVALLRHDLLGVGAWGGDFVIEIAEHDPPEKCVVVDGVDCELERNIINGISHYVTAPIKLQREGGIQSDIAIRITHAAGDEDLVERLGRGVYRGICLFFNGPRLPARTPADDSPGEDRAPAEDRTPAENGTPAGRAVGWFQRLMRWLGVLPLAVLVLVSSALAQEPSEPKPIAAKKKVEILIEQIKVYRRAIERLKAEVEMLKAERDLGQMNAKLDQLEKELRGEAGASAAWRITDTLGWERISVPVVKIQEVK